MRGFFIQRGVTLIEMIMVIVIIGIIGGMVEVFMKSPIDAYIASGLRAAMTDVADTVVRRMARDIHKALPNSILLLTSGSACIEFIPTRTGGRYRDQGGPPDKVLKFNTADDSFNMLGDNAALPVDQQIRNGDLVAVYKLGITGSDAYNLDNITAVVGTPTVAVASGLEPLRRVMAPARFTELPVRCSRQCWRLARQQTPPPPCWPKTSALAALPITPAIRAMRWCARHVRLLASTANPPACPILPTSLPGSTSELSTTPLATLFDGGFNVTVKCSVQRYQGLVKRVTFSSSSRLQRLPAAAQATWAMSSAACRHRWSGDMIQSC